MKKIIIITFLLVLAGAIINIVRTGDKRTTYSGLKTALGMAHIKTYQDTVFGYTVGYPDFFQVEEVDGDAMEKAEGSDAIPNHCMSYARFAFRREVNVVLETYVLMDANDSIKTKGIISEPIYENGVRIDGYSRYAKYIRSGKSVFVYSLTYPDNYKPILGRLFQLIDEWKVLGAVQ